MEHAEETHDVAGEVAEVAEVADVAGGNGNGNGKRSAEEAFCGTGGEETDAAPDYKEPRRAEDDADPADDPPQAGE